VGEGAVKAIIQDYVRENQLDNVHFIPYQKFEDLKYSLNAADVHLVVNQKGIKGVSVPSKIYGVMAAGRPVLGVLESGSEAHRLITESGCGEVSEPQHYNDIINKLETLYSMERTELNACGLKGRSYLEQHLRKNTSLDKYLVLLKSFQFQQ
jgi:hypothetical protein